MKKTILILCVFGLILPAFAQTAVFQKISGKVEYQTPGKDWKAATAGLAIPAGTMVSTGFKSDATLNLSGTLINLRPLTRLSLDELIASGTGSKAKVFLVGGKVQFEVKPGAVDSGTALTIKSPTATASVRGTGGIFDGVNLIGRHGVIVYSTPQNISRTVQGGEFSTIMPNGSVRQSISVTKVETSPLEGQSSESVNFDNANYGNYSIEDAYSNYGDSLTDMNIQDTINQLADEIAAYFGDDVSIPGYLEKTKVRLLLH